MKTFPTPASLLLTGALLLGVLPAFAGHDEEEGDATFAKLDANGDGRVSRAEHVTGSKAMFIAMDANHDGAVTAAEMDAYGAQQKDAAIRFRASGPADGAGSGAARADGSASSNEVANARAATPPEPTSAEMIRLLDQDGDGRLTAAEHETGSAVMFARTDTDGDGTISKAECAAGRAKVGNTH